MTGVALDHLVGGLKAGVRDLGHAELLVVRLLRGDDRSVGDLQPQTTDDNVPQHNWCFNLRGEMMQSFETGRD